MVQEARNRTTVRGRGLGIPPSVEREQPWQVIAASFLMLMLMLMMNLTLGPDVPALSNDKFKALTRLEVVFVVRKMNECLVAVAFVAVRTAASTYGELIKGTCEPERFTIKRQEGQEREGEEEEEEEEVAALPPRRT